MTKVVIKHRASREEVVWSKTQAKGRLAGPQLGFQRRPGWGKANAPSFRTPKGPSNVTRKTILNFDSNGSAYFYQLQTAYKA